MSAVRAVVPSEAEGRGGRAGAGASQPSASSCCVAPQHRRATLTMALGASRTLLTLFVTFCAPGCGWTGIDDLFDCLHEQVHGGFALFFFWRTSGNFWASAHGRINETAADCDQYIAVDCVFIFA